MFSIPSSILAAQNMQAEGTPIFLTNPYKAAWNSNLANIVQFYVEPLMFYEEEGDGMDACFRDKIFCFHSETDLKACWLGRFYFQHALMRQILACLCVVQEQTNIQNLPGGVLCMLGFAPAILILIWMIITSHATCDGVVWRHTVLYGEASFETWK